MKLLAIDTSSVACTVAARVGETLVQRHAEQAREHTRLLMPMIREVLEESGIELADFDAIVLGNGPGSFIGMRIAASVAQGLAHGAGLQIIPVSSLAAVAAQVFAESDAKEVAVAQDAHMGEVYLGLYARGEDGLPESIVAERLQAQKRIGELDRKGRDQRVAAGKGWRRYPGLMAVNEAFFSGQSKVLYPRAEYLLGLAEKLPAIEAQTITPAYLRQKVAEKPATRITN